MKIYLATANADKRREVSELLPQCKITIPSEEGIEFSPKETGETFRENSMIKALDLWKKVRAPVLADDSGLCVDALFGAPGVFSSRYAGAAFMRGFPDEKKISQKEQNLLLIEQTNAAIAAKKTDFSNFPNGARSCRYVCAMTLLFDPNRFFVVQETMEGVLVSNIAHARGKGGFGYDPIVELPNCGGKTVAELSASEKNAISHRGKALRAICRILFP